MAKVLFKVICWEGVDIDDETLPEVIEKIKSKEIITSEDLISNYKDAFYKGLIQESETQMTPEENQDYATIEVYEDKKVIYANGKI